jgi:uncharacterized protein YyaL (SSP411 family)
MYQYSDAVDWESPHYEKLMWVQAQAIDLHASSLLDRGSSEAGTRNEEQRGATRSTRRNMTA